MKKIRQPRKLPDERFVYTEETSGILAEDPITALNKSNSQHPSFDPDHPRPIKGPKGAPNRWWLPDVYRYVEILKRRSEAREQQRVDAAENIRRSEKRKRQHVDVDERAHQRADADAAAA